MADELNIVHDFDTFRRAISFVPTDVERQFAFALNRLAKAVQAEARDRFDETYIERTKFMENSIIVNNAKKGRLEARVGTMNRKMALHLFGGAGKQDVAQIGIRGADKRGRVAKNQTVAALEKRMAKPGPHSVFKVMLNGREYIAAKGPGTKERERVRNGYSGPVVLSRPFSLLWKLQNGQATKVRADWPLEKIMQDVLDAKGEQIFTEIIEEAWEYAVRKGQVAGRF